MTIKSFNIDYMSGGEQIILYGAAVWGRLAFNALESLGIKPLSFCDRAKSGEIFCGIQVISPEELKKYPNAHILICATVGFKSIKEYLIENGMKNYYDIYDLLKYVDFNKIEKSYDILSYDSLLQKYKLFIEENSKEEVNLPIVNLSITEKCSLKCKKCSALMPYFENPQNYEVKDIKESFGKLINCVDSIIQLSIIGGEPFMHNKFAEILTWCVKQEKIKEIVIVSNATIIPNKESIKAMGNDKVRVLLDDYGDISKNLNNIVKLLTEEKIEFYVQKLDRWQDMGELKFRNYSIENQKQIFNNCILKDCVTFIKGRLYRCSYAGESVNLDYTPDNENDYVDVLNESMSKTQLREKIISIIFDKEYLTACNYCSGSSITGKGILVAEQLH